MSAILARVRVAALAVVAALAFGVIVPLSVTAGPADSASAVTYDSTYNIACGDNTALLNAFKVISGTNVRSYVNDNAELNRLVNPHSVHVVLNSNNVADCKYNFTSAYDGLNALPVIGGDMLNSFWSQTATRHNSVTNKDEQVRAFTIRDAITIDGNNSSFVRTGSAPFRFIGITGAVSTLTINDLNFVGGQAPDGTHEANHDWWKYVLSIASQITMALATAGASSWLQGAASISIAVPTVLTVASGLNTLRKGVMAVVNDVGPVTPGGNGGAIASDGALTLNHVSFRSNRAGDGGNGADATGQDGAGGGSGGAVYVSPTGSLTVTNSTFTGNGAGTGGVGSYGASPFTGGGGTGGDGGDGGAIASFGPTTISGTMFQSNTAGTAGRPGRNWGVATTGGKYGNGGAVLLGFSSGDSTVDSSSFVSNGNLAGKGGAIATVMAAAAKVTNSTFQYNGASWGGSLAALDSYAFVLNGNSIDVRNSVFSEGYSDNDGSIAYASPGDSISFANSVLFHSAGPTLCRTDGSGSITTHSLVTDSSSDPECPSTVTPQSLMLPLTPTSIGTTIAYVPIAGSTLLNAGDAVYCPAADQRGLPRKVGACDIGTIDHFEWAATSLSQLYASTSNFGSFTGQTGWETLQQYDLPYWQQNSSGYLDSYLTPATRVLSPNQHPYFYRAPVITAPHVHYELRVFVRGVRSDITRDVRGQLITDLLYVPLRFSNWGDVNVELWVTTDFGDRIKLDSKALKLWNGANHAPALSVTPTYSGLQHVTQYETKHIAVTVTDPDEAATWTFKQTPSCGTNATLSNLTTTATSFEFDCAFGAGASSNPWPHSEISASVIDDQGALNSFVQFPNPQIEFQPVYLSSTVSRDYYVAIGAKQRMDYVLRGDHTELTNLAQNPAAIGTQHCGQYLTLVAGSQTAVVDGTTLNGSFECVASDLAGAGKSVGGLQGTWMVLSGGWVQGSTPSRNYTILSPVDASIYYPVYFIQGYGDVNQYVNLGTLTYPNPTNVGATYIDWGDGTEQLISGTGWAPGMYGHAYVTPGAHTITVSAWISTDGAGLTAGTKFPVWSTTVYDTETARPVITVPDSIVLSNESAEAATVHYVATATEPFLGALTPSCTIAAGTVLPVGVHTVTCSARSSKWLSYPTGINNPPSPTGSASFQVTVVDVNAPVLGIPTIAMTTDGDATTVDYTVPFTDDSATTLACDVPTGSVFLAGVTTVTCTATDAANNKASTSFLVNVGDGSGPVITVPEIVEATSPNGAGLVVTYAVSAVDAIGAAVTPSCLPASGSRFAPGTTTVSCTATDGNGNWSSTSFPVRVYGGVVADPLGLLIAFSQGGQVVGGHRMNAVKLGGDIAIERASDGSGQSLHLASGDIVTLDLAGHELKIDAPSGNAGIEVPLGASLTIVDTSVGHTGKLTIRAQGGGAAIGGAVCRSAGSIVIGAGVNGTALSVGGDGIGGGAAIGAGAAPTSAVIANWGINQGTLNCDTPLSGGTVQFTGAAYGSTTATQSPSTAGGTSTAPGAAVSWVAPTGAQPREAVWKIVPTDSGDDGGIGFEPSGWLAVDLQGGTSGSPLGGPLAEPSQVVLPKASINPGDLFGSGAAANLGVADPVRTGYYFGGWRLGSATGPVWGYDRSSAAADPLSRQNATVYASWIRATGTGSTLQLNIPVGADILLDLRGAQLSINSSGTAGPGVHLPAGATFTVADTVGSGNLDARGGNGAAGIGGASGEDGGKLIVTGSVTGTGYGGAGVGGGQGGSGGTVDVRFGALVARSYGYDSVAAGAAVGAGAGGATGGTVTTYGSAFGALPTSGGGPVAATYTAATGAGSVIGSTGASTFFAQVGYGLTFHLGGLSSLLVGPTTVQDGATVLSRVRGGYLVWVTEAPPVRDGYHFDGWYTDATLTQPIDPAHAVLTGPIGLYAKWVTDRPDLVPSDSLYLGNFPVRLGATLEISLPSNWNAGAVTPELHYQWLRNDVPIRDAPDQPTYVLQIADIGRVVKVQVTATADGYDPYVWVNNNSSGVAEGILEVAVNTRSDDTFGAPRIGDTLWVDDTWHTYVNDTDAVEAHPTVQYVWMRDGVPIAGAANAPSYAVQVADIGYRLSVSVTGVANGYKKYTLPDFVNKSGPVTSHNFTIPASPSITSTCSPIVNGCALLPVPGTWGGVPGLQLKYQWFSGQPGQNYTEIPSSSLTTPTNDPLRIYQYRVNDQWVPAGNSVYLAVTATAPGYNAVTLYSQPVYVDGVQFTSTTSPTVSQMDNKLTAGGRLRATIAAWAPDAYFTYQWYVRDSMAGPDQPIGGATGPQFTIPSGWDGKFVFVVVTGTKSGYYAVNKSSNLVELPPRFVVDFDSAGGSTVNDGRVLAGTSVGQPTAPTRSGYTFGGWYDEGGTLFNFAQVITYDRVVTAHWTRIAGVVDSWEVLQEAVASAPTNGTPVTLKIWNEISADQSRTLTGDNHLDLVAGTNVTIDLNGQFLYIENLGAELPAIAIPSGAQLTIIDTVGGGSMSARTTGGGAGIGGAVNSGALGTLTIASGMVTAGSASGAGIGGGAGGDGGSVTITGGSVSSESDSGAGIGGGEGGNGGELVIQGGYTQTNSSQAASFGAGLGGTDGGTVRVAGTGLGVLTIATPDGTPASTVVSGGVPTGPLTAYSVFSFTSPGFTLAEFTYGHAVHFDYDGGTSPDGWPAALAVPDGSAAYFDPTPARDGYVFMGWYADAARTILPTTHSDGYGSMVADITGDTTFYADWFELPTVGVAVDSSAGDCSATTTRPLAYGDLVCATVPGQVVEFLGISAGQDVWALDGRPAQFQWFLDGVPVDSSAASGAHSPQFLVGANAVGQHVTVQISSETAFGAGFTIEGGGGDVAPVLNLEAPVISGNPVVGETLEVSAGTWTGPTPSTWNITWLRDGDPVSNDSEYTLVNDDAGHDISAVIGWVGAGYDPPEEFLNDMFEAASAPVTVADLATWTSSPKPFISGWEHVGSTLAVVLPTAWSPVPSTLTYQWLQDGTPIAGAVGATHQLTADDAGHVLTVAITGHRSGYEDMTVLSYPSSRVLVTGTFDSAVLQGALTIPGSAFAGLDPDAAFRVSLVVGGRVIEQAVADVIDPVGAPGEAAFGLTVPAGTTDFQIVVTAVVRDGCDCGIGSTWRATWSPSSAISLGSTFDLGTLTLAPSTLVQGSVVGPVGATELAIPVAYVLDGGTWRQIDLIDDPLTMGATEVAALPASGSGSDAWSTGDLEPGTYRFGLRLTDGDHEYGTWFANDVGGSGDWAQAQSYSVTAGSTLVVPLQQVGALVSVASITNLVLPSISGALEVGGHLTAGVGVWTPTGAFCDCGPSFGIQWLANGVAIPGATSREYVVTPSDTGARISVRVTVAFVGLTTQTATSPQTATITSGVFVKGTPTITGSATVGSQLTIDRGTWSPVPTTFTYQWYRNGVAIAGATGLTHDVTGDDYGTWLVARVWGASNGYVTANAYSPSRRIGTGVFVKGEPTITGSAMVGSLLTVDPGTWSPVPTTYTYQWFRNGVEIAGATGATRVVTADDYGNSLVVRVWGTSTGYVTANAYSPSRRIGTGVFVKSDPLITGSASVGSQLSADVGTWSPTPTTFTYQWFRNGVAIPGSTGATHDVTVDDYGTWLVVRVWGASSGFVTANAYSPSRRIGAGTFVKGTPAITGTATVGSRLTIDAGAWAPVPATFTYQWFRNGVAIPGATGSTYDATVDDRGTWLVVRVWGASSTYTTANAYSASRRIG
jgi:uncharacterized repeat protein (TIGR02543 family)